MIDELKANVSAYSKRNSYKGCQICWGHYCILMKPKMSCAQNSPLKNAKSTERCGLLACNHKDPYLSAIFLNDLHLSEETYEK